LRRRLRKKVRGSILRDARLIRKEGDGATEVTTVDDPMDTGIKYAER